MERESTKHGPRLDDELVHESSALLQGAPVVGQSRDDLRQEDPDEGLDDVRTRPDVPEVGAVTSAEATARAELARAVAGAHFPARREDLVTAASRTDADPSVAERLSTLPSGQHFDNVQAVWAALGGHQEDRSNRGGR